MKVVIFAGGLGSRLSEETMLKPKPMVEVGEKPILWHIMKIYSHFGFNDFIICLGYKGHIIKDWFVNYFLYNADITVNMTSNELQIHSPPTEQWTVTLVETGLTSGTAERLNRIKQYIGNEDFMLTYGDGLADINLTDLIAYHRSHNKIATVTAVRPIGRFGIMKVSPTNKMVEDFVEKGEDKIDWINGGFFVLKPDVFKYVDGVTSMWEKQPLENLAHDGQLAAFHHGGFWKPMDTQRDKQELDDLWNKGNAPWKLWDK